jgi:homoserine dehydrogenase
MAKKVKIGLFGLGVVGSGLLEIVNRRRELLLQHFGIELEIVRAVVKDPTKRRKLAMAGVEVGTCADDILNDDTIDIIVELMGGTEFAYDVVKSSLLRGIPVVCANKALVAEKGVELMEIARENRVPFFAEASVGGGIPILKTLRESLVANEISSLTAIINGTTNFILTKMNEEGLSYFEALKLASELGFAEADPTLDVEGIDASQKLRILAAHMASGQFPEGEILCEGITHLTSRDFRFAQQQNMTIKLLAIARRYDQGYQLRVHPTLIPSAHPLANVRNEFNAVYLVGDALGALMLEGKGAGSLPTASAVYSDIIDICSKATIDNGHVRIERQPVSILPVEQVECEYYLRFTISDEPGVIGKIASMLGDYGISVVSASAELIPNIEDMGEVHIIVHKTTESSLNGALAAINQLKQIQGEGRIIRIERDI